MPVPTHPVKVALAQRGERPSELAVRAGYSSATVSQVLNGHSRPWAEFRRRVAEALDMPESELFPTGDGAA